MNLFPLALLFFGGIILTAGDIVAKQWVVSNKNYLFLLVLFLYLFGLIFLIFSFKYKNIAAASLIFVIFNIITLTLVSWFYFNERLTTIELIGIMLGLISVSLLEYSAKD
jgi:multidrug transporter EmrE-like cation transporter